MVIELQLIKLEGEFQSNSIIIQESSSVWFGLIRQLIRIIRASGLYTFFTSFLFLPGIKNIWNLDNPLPHSVNFNGCPNDNYYYFYPRIRKSFLSPTIFQLDFNPKCTLRIKWTSTGNIRERDCQKIYLISDRHQNLFHFLHHQSVSNHSMELPQNLLFATGHKLDGI